MAGVEPDGSVRLGSVGEEIGLALFRGGEQLCKLGPASQLRPRGIVLQNRVGTIGRAGSADCDLSPALC